jgi:hypothetical protein
MPRWLFDFAETVKILCKENSPAVGPKIQTLSLFPIDSQQLNLKVQNRIARNNGRIPTCSIPIIPTISIHTQSIGAGCLRGNVQFGLLAKTQLRNTFVPSFNHLSNSNLARKWVACHQLRSGAEYRDRGTNRTCCHSQVFRRSECSRCLRPWGSRCHCPPVQLTPITKSITEIVVFVTPMIQGE